MLEMGVIRMFERISGGMFRGYDSQTGEYLFEHDFEYVVGYPEEYITGRVTAGGVKDVQGAD